MPNPPKILVVDDDLRLRQLLQRYLVEQGFGVFCVANGADMEQPLKRRHFDALVLDLMLPGEDGLSICRRLRAAENPIPILILTAKGDEIDRILGLEMGADDYLPKPFNPRELVARLHAILRRTQQIPGAPSAAAATIQFGPFRLDPSTRTLRRDGHLLPLTSGEFALLKALADHPQRPLSRDRLMSLSRGKEHTAFDRSIDVQISRLRRLLEDDPSHPRYIQTVWGMGYVFVPEGTRN